MWTKIIRMVKSKREQTYFQGSLKARRNYIYYFNNHPKKILPSATMFVQFIFFLIYVLLSPSVKYIQRKHYYEKSNHLWPQNGFTNEMLNKYTHTFPR